MVQGHIIKVSELSRSISFLSGDFANIKTHKKVSKNQSLKLCFN